MTGYHDPQGLQGQTPSARRSGIPKFRSYLAATQEIPLPDNARANARQWIVIQFGHRREFPRWHQTEVHMKPQHEVHSVRESKGKQFWTRLGVAFPDEGGSITILLEAMPASTNGQYKLVLLPPKAKDDVAE